MPRVRLAAVAVAYGTLLLVGAAAAVGRSSAVLSIAAALLLAVATPWLVVQGLVTLVRGERTPLHRTIALLSLAFPPLLATLLVMLRGGG